MIDEFKEAHTHVRACICMYVSLCECVCERVQIHASRMYEHRDKGIDSAFDLAFSLSMLVLRTLLQERGK